MYVAVPVAAVVAVAAPVAVADTVMVIAAVPVPVSTSTARPVVVPALRPPPGNKNRGGIDIVCVVGDTQYTPTATMTTLI